MYSTISLILLSLFSYILGIIIGNRCKAKCIGDFLYAKDESGWHYATIVNEAPNTVMHESIVCFKVKKGKIVNDNDIK